MELRDIKHLPAVLQERETRRVKFYRTSRGYSTNTGNYVHIPNWKPEYFFCSPLFQDKYEVRTWGDLFEFLDKYGFCPDLSFSLLFDYGFKFNQRTWCWENSRGVDFLRKPILKIEAFSGGEGMPRERPSRIQALGLEVQPVFHGLLSNPDNITVQYTEGPVTDLPLWMCRKNRHSFTPDEFKYFSLPNERTRRYFGMEIEMLTEYSPLELQLIATELEPKQDPFFYFVHDGTIMSHAPSGERMTALELVTMPATRKYFKKYMRVFFQKLSKLEGGLGLFKTNSGCGIHVHVSRSGFYDRFHVKKFVAMMNQYDKTNSELISHLGRRPFSEYNKPNTRQTGMTVAYRLKQPVSSEFNFSSVDKYSTCRLTSATAEVRIFASKFELEHILYCIDTVQLMIEFTEKLPIRNIGSPRFKPSFLSFLKHHPEYSHVTKELKECA